MRVWRESNIELRQLRYFVKIVDLGSFSRAAGALYIAQSALSQQVAALESELGAMLLIRSARGVTPTASGDQLYRHAQIILKQEEDARVAVSSSFDRPSGVVALGVPLSLAGTFALPVLQAVRKQFPLISLQIHEELSGTILEWVKNGRLAIGLAFDDGNFEGLHAAPTLEERLYLVVHPKSPLAKRKSITCTELQSVELILPTREQGNRTRLEYMMVRAGLVPPKVVVEANSQTLMLQAVASGIAATVLAWPGIIADVDAHRLCGIEIVRPTLTRVSSLCVLSSSPLTRAVQCVLLAAADAIREAVHRERWRGVRFLGGASGEAANPTDTPATEKPLAAQAPCTTGES